MGEGIFLFKVDPKLTSNKEINPVHKDFSFYPNPFGSFLHFDIYQKGKENIDFKLYNVNGELVLHKSLSEPTFEAETTHLSNGMYFVILQTSNNKWVQKLIKQ